MGILSRLPVSQGPTIRSYDNSAPFSVSQLAGSWLERQTHTCIPATMGPAASTWVGCDWGLASTCSSFQQSLLWLLPPQGWVRRYLCIWASFRTWILLGKVLILLRTEAVALQVIHFPKDVILWSSLCLHVIYKQKFQHHLECPQGLRQSGPQSAFQWFCPPLPYVIPALRLSGSHAWSVKVVTVTLAHAASWIQVVALLSLLNLVIFKHFDCVSHRSKKLSMFLDICTVKGFKFKGIYN